MWLKNVVLEVAVTLIIVLATVPDLSWARWIVIVYTPLMLLLKIVSVVGTGFSRAIKVTDRGVPDWFWHANYAVNIALLAADRWWIMAAGWGLIWLLSIAYLRRVRGPGRTSRA